MKAPLRCDLVTLSRFAHQCSTLLNAGLGIVGALRVLAAQEDHSDLHQALQAVCDKIETGYSLSQALAEYPRVFGTTTILLVRAGEESGQMESLFRRLSDWLEKDSRVVQRSRQALVYPTMVVGTSLLLGWVLFTFFLPPFFEAFHDSGTTLPWLTRMVLVLVHLVGSPLSWILVGGMTWGLVRWASRAWYDKQQRLRFFALLGRLPILGRIVLLTSAVRFCNCLSLLLEVGVPLLRAWELAAGASGNASLEHDARRVTQAMQTGETLGTSMGESPLYPRGMNSMLATAEESASIPRTLKCLAQIYDQESEQSTQTLAILLEPLFIAGMAVVVVVILLAVLLPLYGSLAQFGA